MGINLVPTEISNLYNPILAEIFFSIIGLVFIATGVQIYSFLDCRCFDCCQCGHYRDWRCGSDQE